MTASEALRSMAAWAKERADEVEVRELDAPDPAMLIGAAAWKVAYRSWAAEAERRAAEIESEPRL